MHQPTRTIVRQYVIDAGVTSGTSVLGIMLFTLIVRITLVTLADEAFEVAGLMIENTGLLHHLPEYIAILRASVVWFQLRRR